MRKHLTAKLFKRLSLVALVLSLVGWGVSEYVEIHAGVSHFDVKMSDGRLRFVYATRGGWNGGAFDAGCKWLMSPRFDFPPPQYEQVVFGPAPLNRQHLLRIPFWLTFLIALVAFLYFRHRERRSAIAPGCCVHCGYDASKCTDNRCSECGEALVADAEAAG